MQYVVGERAQRTSGLQSRLGETSGMLLKATLRKPIMGDPKEEGRQTELAAKTIITESLYGLAYLVRGFNPKLAEKLQKIARDSEQWDYKIPKVPLTAI